MYPFFRRLPARWAAVFLFIVSTAVAADPSEPTAGSSTSRTALNPEISLDGLFSFTQFNQDNPLVFDGGHDPRLNGFNLQQVELAFVSTIDPYFKANAYLVMTSEGIEVEEAYAVTLEFPWNLQLRGGQFYTVAGRQNTMHPHAWNFANKPLVLSRFFGGDGLRNPGAELSWLTPLPWYSEIIVSAQNSTGETAVSFRPDGKMRSIVDAVMLARLNNFFGIAEDWSLNVGLSYLNGANATSDSSRTRIYGGDLYLKYRPVSGTSFVSLTVEALRRSYDGADGELSDWGWYSELNYRLPEGMSRWHVGLRYDWASTKNGVPVITATGDDGAGNPVDLDTAERFRISPVITFYPSEFSKVRFQYDYDKPADFETAQHAVSVQLEFLMGAHGAHKF